MYISQCLITKNEEKNIEYCLSHLKGIVDEQIVVDTGSTDKTVELSKQMGAKLFKFKWIDNFSAARNYALEKAKGDWIIFLDADEYFSEESVKFIKKYINEIGENKNVDGLTCELINIDFNRNIISTAKQVSPRIFKNKKNIRYRSKIHETLFNIKRPETNYAMATVDVSSNIKIFHTGYDKQVMDEKMKNNRNIDLLEHAIAENSEDPKLYLYLSKQQYMDQKYKESLESANKALTYIKNSIDPGWFCMIYSTKMYAMIALEMSFDELKIVFDEAVGKYPGYPDYYRVMGMASLRENKIKLAIEYLEQSIYYCNDETNTMENVARGQVKDIYRDLLRAYVADENKPKIVEISVALLNSDKYNYELLTILIKTFLTQEKEENIVQFLNKIYNYNIFKDKIYLLKASEAAGNETLISFYKGLLNEEELNAVEGSELLGEEI